MDAQIHEPMSATMPAGRYFVGDPCYAVPDEDWMTFLALADPDVFGDGATSHNCKRILLAEVKGNWVLGIGTAYGDGEYRDQQGNRYAVDAGLIGLVPETYGQKEQKRYSEQYRSRVVEFARPFTVAYEDGVIVLGDIRIDTDPDDESDDWD